VADSGHLLSNEWRRLAKDGFGQPIRHWMIWEFFYSHHKDIENRHLPTAD
jgi:hypothetical protein